MTFTYSKKPVSSLKVRIKNPKENGVEIKNAYDFTLIRYKRHGNLKNACLNKPIVVWSDKINSFALVYFGVLIKLGNGFYNPQNDDYDMFLSHPWESYIPYYIELRKVYGKLTFKKGVWSINDFYEE